MSELKPTPCPNDSIVEACRPWVEAIDGTNSKGFVEPCRFCGHSAWLQPYNEGRNYQSPGSHPTGIFLQCSNSKCCATMHRNQCWVDDAHTALEAPQVLVDALLARWNTRAAPERHNELREALQEVHEHFELVDADGERAKCFNGLARVAVEDAAVLELCQRHGFGAVMDSAARQWYAKDPLGAFVIGSCAGLVRPLKAKVAALVALAEQAAPVKENA